MLGYGQKFLKAAAVAAALLVCAMPAFAQEQASGILTVDSESLFAQSAFGRRVAREIEADSQALEAENRQIEAELQAEEQELTLRRPQVTPEAFRALADAFDEKVQRIRVQQNSKARALQSKLEEERLKFLGVVGDVLEGLLAERGAVAILDVRQVFFAVRAIDVTQSAIEKVDAAVGDGADLEVPSAVQPEAPKE